MITKIENGNVIVEEYGLPPGTYPIHALTIEELDKERAQLHIKYFRELPLEDAKKLGDLIEQISRIITQKCQDADEMLRDYLGYSSEEKKSEWDIKGE